MFSNCASTSPNRIFGILSRQTFRLSLSFLIGVFAGSGIAPAQEKKTTIQIQSKIRPAYSVSPSVYRIKAKHGQRKSFAFSIKAKEDDVVATIKAIALRQNVNGAILADMESAAPKQLKIEGGNEITIPAGETRVMKGTVAIPTDGSPLYTFGLLIRDEGRRIDGKKKDDAKFGIKFITQYIIRCDIEIPNVTNTYVHQLEVDSVEVVDHQGLPMTKVFVTNPSDKTIKFEVESRMHRSKSTIKNRYIKQVSPIQQNMRAPERFAARILPGSRVVLSAPWPKPVFKGNYRMENRLVLNNRVYKTDSKLLVIDNSFFRAQDVYVSNLGEGIYASPAQIAIGKSKPYKRISTVRITNDSDQPVTIDLQPKDADGKPLGWVTVQPAKLTISPAASRRVLVSLRHVDDDHKHRFGFLDFATMIGSGKSEKSQRIPIAFMGREAVQPRLAIGKIRMEKKKFKGSLQPCLILPIMNKSTVPIPMIGDLVAVDRARNQLSSKAGFGKWLLPKEVRELVFQIGEFDETSNIQGALQLKDLANRVYFSKEWEYEGTTRTISFQKK